MVIARDDRFWRLRFAGTGALAGWLEQHGDMPLPPYIARTPGQSDDARYQTVYAREPGAVAAPTAGLHFDEAMLANLDRLGVDQAFVTLHVGAGTFAPVKSDDLAQHRMHSEWYRIPEETAQKVRAARARGGRVIAVGTTSLRALESAAGDHGLREGSGETSLFISLSRGRSAAHQLPPAKIDAADAGLGVRRIRKHPRGLRARHCREVPILQLWRCDVPDARVRHCHRLTPKPDTRKQKRRYLATIASNAAPCATKPMSGRGWAAGLPWQHPGNALLSTQLNS